MLKRKIIYVVFALATSVGYAQYEASNWYFGSRSGLTFANNTIIPDINGKVNTLEGSSTISDSAGNLLFYTDGKSVWSRNHILMEDGFDLLGDSSSSQSCIILPNPSNLNQYYIFTTDVVQAYFQNGHGNGINYSIVDMTLNNGLGKVIVKNINLLPEGSEKISAIRSANDVGYYIVTHFENRFVAFRIDENGLNTDPIVSSIGPNISNFRNRRGCLKISPNGKKLVVAHGIYDPDFDGYLYLYDFDASTGIVSNEELLSEGRLYYGVEFSPDSKIVYASARHVEAEGLSFGDESYIYQFNYENTNTNNIEYLIHMFEESVATSGPGSLSGSLQIGIDKKIYHSIPGNAISVIQEPNLPKEASSFAEYAVHLGGRSAQYGLPSFDQSNFESVITIENSCFGSLTQFGLLTDELIDSVTWNFGDIDSGTLNTSTLLSPFHEFTDIGQYEITVEINYSNKPPRTFVEYIEITDFPYTFENVELFQCAIDEDNDDTAIFNLNDATAEITEGNATLNVLFFENSSDISTNENVLSGQGYQSQINNQIIYAKIFGLDVQCYKIVEVKLNVIPSSFLGELSEFKRCIDFDSQINIQQLVQDLETEFNGTSVSIYLNEIDASLELNEITNNLEANLLESEYIFFRADIGQSCNYIGKINIRLIDEPDITEYTLSFCPQKENILDAGLGYERYLWSTGEETSQIEIEAAGNYWVEVFYDEECSSVIDFNVMNSPDFEIVEVRIEDFSLNNTIKIVLNNYDGDVLYSIDGGFTFSENNSFENVLPGLYDVFVAKDNCHFRSTIIAVGGFPQFFTPNNDGHNDVWKMKNPEYFLGAIIEIFDRYGKLIKVIDSTAGWNGFFNNKLMRESDYWYRITMDGKTKTGHFSLIID